MTRPIATHTLLTPPQLALDKRLEDRSLDLRGEGPQEQSLACAQHALVPVHLFHRAQSRNHHSRAERGNRLVYLF